MAFKPNEIAKEHVLKAIEKIEAENIALIPPTRWEVEINGKNYPPKEVMRYAHQQMNGEKVWNYGGGEGTNKYLKKMAFPIIDTHDDPIKDIIRKYKNYVREGGLKDEIYKWNLLAQFKGRPNTKAINFYEEIKTINFANLIYPVGQAVVKHLAQARTEPYRDCFKVLFDEDMPLLVRIKYFNDETLKVYREIVPEEKFSHHQDERTMATFLTYHNPDKYTFYKHSFYQKYCDLLGLKSKKKGEKYFHYLELINDFISEYIIEDQELIDLVRSKIPINSFEDVNHKILAQDILYQSLDGQLGSNKKYWRVGTKDEHQSYWEIMKKDDKIGIGWSDIGDLDNTTVSSKNEIITLLKSQGFFKNDNLNLSKKAGEIFNFYSNIKIGDVIIAQDGETILGIGIVKDDYCFNANDNFSHQKLVDWKVFNPDLKNSQGNRTTVYQVTNSNVINKVEALLNESNTAKMGNAINPNDKPLNQILYGPPGTGKTYNTINKALLILETKTEEEINTEERDVLKARFDDYIKNGQIVFTTFHQSMSYEDFIEGIKPLKPEDEDEFVKYDIEEGIFKRLCRQAIKEFYQKGTNDETFERLNSFENAWNDLLENVQNSIDNNGVFPLDTKSGQAMDAFEISNRGNLYLRPQYEGAKDYTVSHDRSQKLFEAFPNLEVVNNIDKEFRSVIGGSNSTAYWSVLNYIITWLNENPTAPSIQQATEISDTLIKFDNKIVKENIESKVLNYVIIIDEINRGNVSQIFGELITLIEEDKRLGKDEALEVMLPYSKEKFGVPPNLYIVGTMNTADRSVEALDTALRRRFCFEEIEPNSQLIATKGKLKESNGEVEGVNLPRVLKTINNRIEILSNRDHKIGHSYFMKVASLADLKATFKKNIIPLLQEYFYNDYEKIGWVLGEGFFVQQKIDKKAIFTKFFKESKPEFEVAYQLADIDTIDIKKAMLQLLGDYKEETQV